MKNEIISYLKKNLSDKKFNHTLNVAEYAVMLAKKHNESIEDVEIAALLHDIAREKSNVELLSMLEKYNIQIDDETKNHPPLIHGHVGALLAKKYFNIKNKDIIEAIKYHTTGIIGMSKLAKIVFIADKLEKDRNFDGIKEIRKESLVDLDNTIIMIIVSMEDYLKKINSHHHSDTIDLLNYLKNNKKL